MKKSKLFKVFQMKNFLSKNNTKNILITGNDEKSNGLIR